MKKLLVIFAALGFALTSVAHADLPDWSEGANNTPERRRNPYGLEGAEWESARRAGQVHAQVYPVTVTGMLPPLAPMRRMLEANDSNPLKQVFKKVFRGLTGFHEINDVLKWMGLHENAAPDATGIYAIPYPNGTRPEWRMGFGAIQHPLGTGFSLSCAACHSANLFGRTVLGLTNRFPRANEVFVYAKEAFPLMTPWFFQLNTGATDGERELFARTRDNMHRVGTKMPAALGLDTSLAQVSLSLAHRNQDAYATPSSWLETFPRAEPLGEMVADSKPAVWWNLKYKNRWLSDGSVVAGNPIFTNILWNEIGRGADLQELEGWLRDNDRVIQELTTAVFATEAPRYTDFFPAESLALADVKAGEVVFNQRCARCHGTYEKAWNQAGAEAMTAAERLATLKVVYREKTPVIDVGTDPGRYRGMKSLEQLNDLAISRNNGIVIKAQKGYVPPPLVGIWARWPYFHNNSVPSLCALLTRGELRPKVFFTGEANDPARDFDQKCNGYPVGDATPGEWKRAAEHRFDAGREGLGNFGHDEGIFLEKGKELLSSEEKRTLIRFLQTL